MFAAEVQKDSSKLLQLLLKESLEGNAFSHVWSSASRDDQKPFDAVQEGLEFIKQGDDPHTTDGFGKTLLMRALEFLDYNNEANKILINELASYSKNAPAHIRFKLLEQLMPSRFEAIFFGLLEEVQYENVVGRAGDTVLHEVCSYAVDCIDRVVKPKLTPLAEVEVRSKGLRELNFIIEKMLLKIQTLVQHGGNIYQKNEDGESPINILSQVYQFLKERFLEDEANNILKNLKEIMRVDYDIFEFKTPEFIDLHSVLKEYIGELCAPPAPKLSEIAAKQMTKNFNNCHTIQALQNFICNSGMQSSQNDEQGDGKEKGVTVNESENNEQFAFEIDRIWYYRFNLIIGRDINTNKTPEQFLPERIAEVYIGLAKGCKSVEALYGLYQKLQSDGFVNPIKPENKGFFQGFFTPKNESSATKVLNAIKEKTSQLINIYKAPVGSRQDIICQIMLGNVRDLCKETSLQKGVRK